MDKVKAHEHLIKSGWECTVDPPTATLGSGNVRYSLAKIPGNLTATMPMKELTLNDASIIQGVMERLSATIEKEVVNGRPTHIRI